MFSEGQLESVKASFLALSRLKAQSQNESESESARNE